MIFAYGSFSAARYLPWHGLQCILLALLTSALVIWPVNDYWLYNLCPDWINYWFETEFCFGLYSWVALIMVYFVVGYYGHEDLARVRTHPIVGDATFQSR